MQIRRSVPMPKVDARSIALGVGMDVMSSPLSARPGSAKASMNYEVVFGGGIERIRGLERVDGRPSPSKATYTTLVPATTFSDAAVGDILTGASSGATGEVVYVSAGYLALTKVTGTFTAEQILHGATPIGMAQASTPDITAEQDNVLYAAAAEAYRTDITAVPGSGPVRGIAALGSTLYAWRDNAGGTACVIHKSTSAGWVAVPMYYTYRFTSGTSAYVDGGTLTQGAVSATIKRVVLESGTWGSSAAGQLIVSLPTGGNFANGAAAGSGACTLSSVPATTALAQIALLPGGKVETEVFNFLGGSSTKRLYGCDGVNPEFEFDGDVFVPLTIGMSMRAKFVRCHKKYLWFGFPGGSLQKSVVGTPYQWSAILGAAEIGIGDEITGLASIPGNESTSSMAVAGKNSMHILYGSTTDTFSMIPLSQEAGAAAYSLQQLTAPVGYDAQGFRVFRPTQAFGNFAWDISSKLVDKIVRERTPVCSVFSSRYSRYRCFFSDGSAMSGTPEGKGIAWSQINYGITFNVAHAGELDGVERVFYGGDDGFVYEADVGRSFDGQAIQAAITLSQASMGSYLFDKRFRDMEIELAGESAFTLYASAEFDGNDPNNDMVSQQAVSFVGSGGVWDVGLYDAARYDAGDQVSSPVDVTGIGRSISPIFYSFAANELSHSIKSLTISYTPLKLKVPR